MRSDLDLLVIVNSSDGPMRDRLEEFLEESPGYPTDMLVYTDCELQAGLSEKNGFLARAVREAIQLYP